MTVIFYGFDVSRFLDGKTKSLPPQVMAMKKCGFRGAVHEPMVEYLQLSRSKNIVPSHIFRTRIKITPMPRGTQYTANRQVVPVFVCIDFRHVNAYLGCVRKLEQT